MNQQSGTYYFRPTRSDKAVKLHENRETKKGLINRQVLQDLSTNHTIYRKRTSMKSPAGPSQAAISNLPNRSVNRSLEKKKPLTSPSPPDGAAAEKSWPEELRSEERSGLLGVCFVCFMYTSRLCVLGACIREGASWYRL
jgi:hypothetical protein